jgi:hypothetical protein
VAGGNLRLERDAGGDVIEADLRLRTPAIRRGGEVVASLPEATLGSRARVEAGRLREISGGSIRGEALAIEVATARLPAGTVEERAFEIEARADAGGAWLTARARAVLPDGVEFRGPSLRGSVSARAEALRAAGEDLSALEVEAEAGAGRLTIRQGRVRVRGGLLRAAGEMAFLDRARRSDDRLVVEAERIPLEFREPAMANVMNGRYRMSGLPAEIQHMSGPDQLRTKGPASNCGIAAARGPLVRPSDPDSSRFVTREGRRSANETWISRG